MTKADQARTRALITKLEQHKKRIGEERDALRDTLDEYTAIIEACDRADEGLESAVDALSELM